MHQYDLNTGGGTEYFSPGKFDLRITRPSEAEWRYRLPRQFILQCWFKALIAVFLKHIADQACAQSRYTASTRFKSTARSRCLY